MNHKLFHARPVLGHAAKVTAFLGIQFALWIGLTTLATPPKKTAAQNYTEAFLKERLFPYWQDDHELLARLAEGPTEHCVLDNLPGRYCRGPDNYLAAAIDKNRLLREAPGPRLICVGGSGLAFGLDSVLLAARYRYSPINLGLQWILVPRFMMRQTQEYARPGDVVLLIIEAPMMWEDFETLLSLHPRTRRVMKDVAPALARYFEPAPDSTTETSWSEDARQWKQYADSRALPEFADDARGLLGDLYFEAFTQRVSERNRFDREFAKHRAELTKAFYNRPFFLDRTCAQKVCRRRAFNKYGDIIYHRGIPHPKFAEYRFHLNLPDLTNPQTTATIKANVEWLNRFAGKLEARGVDVLFAYPPIAKGDGARAFAAYYAALIEEHLEVPVINNINDMFYGRRLLFNTDQHLNWRGTCRRMTNLVKSLDKHLKPTTPLSPAAHVAARDRAVRPAMIARGGPGPDIVRK